MAQAKTLTQAEFDQALRFIVQESLQLEIAHYF